MHVHFGADNGNGKGRGILKGEGADGATKERLDLRSVVDVK
jgi:hypothetical protein